MIDVTKQVREAIELRVRRLVTDNDFTYPTKFQVGPFTVEDVGHDVRYRWQVMEGTAFRAQYEDVVRAVQFTFCLEDGLTVEDIKPFDEEEQAVSESQHEVNVDALADFLETEAYEHLVDTGRVKSGKVEVDGRTYYMKLDIQLLTFSQLGPDMQQDIVQQAEEKAGWDPNP